MRVQPNTYWWISLAIGTYILGATGSWIFLIFLGAVTVIQGLITAWPMIRAWHESEKEH